MNKRKNTLIENRRGYNGLLIVIFITILLFITIHIFFGLAKGMGIVDSINGGGYALLSGLIGSVLTLGTLPIWENIFLVLTPLKLLELSNPNQPLLKKLLLEAPGTYHHGIMVGNLSEAAVRSIKDLTRDKIEDMVRKVVKGKIDEGQFEECNITLNEIEIIINSFINVLTGIYHDRIEYPNIENNLEVKA